VILDPTIPAFFIASLIIFIGFFGSVLLNRYNVPDAIFLIALGYFLGPGSQLIFGSPLINPSYFKGIAPYIGGLALIAIMFESSLGIDINELIMTARPALILSISSFIVSVIAAFIFLHYVLGLFPDPLVSLLIATIIGGSSGAVVASIAPRVSMPSNMQLTLSLESVLTDVYVIVSAVTILSIFKGGSLLGIEAIGSYIASRFSVSLVIGGLAGIFLSIILHRFRREKHLYVMTFAFLILLYAGTESLGGSGAISVLTAGILLSNIGIFSGFLKNPEMLEIVKFQKYSLETLHSELTLLIRIFFFVEVGLILSFTNLYGLIVALAISFILLFSRLPSAYVTAKVLGFDIGRGTAATTISLFYARGLAAAVMAVIAESQLSQILTNDVAGLLLEIPSAVILFSNLILTVGVALLRKRISRLLY